MKHFRERLLFSLLAVLLLVPIFTVTCQAAEEQNYKLVTFGVNEDYDKNQNLKEIERDFQLMKELEIDEMRVSFGWDDYEPARGKYDFAWLHRFAKLAEKYDIKLHPYICYAAPWASRTGRWNSAPKDFQDWYNFCYKLSKEMSVHPNIVSWEIWNEQDLLSEEPGDGWWGGSIAQFLQLLKTGSEAIRAGAPHTKILIGGFAIPMWHRDFVREIDITGSGKYYDVMPIHCYAETWGGRRGGIEALFDDDFVSFVERYENAINDKPIWINEIGYSVMEKTEEQQANYIARAVGCLFSQPQIKHISWYEIKDMNPGVGAIGDAHNYHLGITTHPDRKPKPAFYTLDMLSDLLNKKRILPAADEAGVKVTAGASENLYKWLFKLDDGSQVLFVYSKESDCTVEVALKTPGKTAFKYELDNTSAMYPEFSNNTISNLRLVADQVAVFKITP